MKGDPKTTRTTNKRCPYHQVNQNYFDLQEGTTDPDSFVAHDGALIQHNVPISHKAQQISEEHFTEFDYILASDKNNLSDLSYVKPADATAVVRLWGSYDDNRAIRDPYYGGHVSHFFLGSALSMRSDSSIASLGLRNAINNVYDILTVFSTRFLEASQNRALRHKLNNLERRIIFSKCNQQNEHQTKQDNEKHHSRTRATEKSRENLSLHRISERVRRSRRKFRDDGPWAQEPFCRSKLEASFLLICVVRRNVILINNWILKHVHFWRDNNYCVRAHLHPIGWGQRQQEFR